MSCDIRETVPGLVLYVKFHLSVTVSPSDPLKESEESTILPSVVCLAVPTWTDMSVAFPLETDTDISLLGKFCRDSHVD